MANTYPIDVVRAIKEAKSQFPLLDAQMKTLADNKVRISVNIDVSDIFFLKEKWAQVPLAERLAILEEIRTTMYSGTFLLEVLHENSFEFWLQLITMLITMLCSGLMLLVVRRDLTLLMLLWHLLSSRRHLGRTAFKFLDLFF